MNATRSGTTGSLARMRRYTLVQLLLAVEQSNRYLDAVRQGQAQMDGLTRQIEERLQANPTQPIQTEQKENSNGPDHT